MLLAACLLPGSALADVIDWNTRPATNLRTGATDTAVINGVTVVTSGSPSGAFDGAGPNILAIEPASTSNGTTGYINSFMNATVGDETSFHLVTITFNEPVYNVSLLVGDIDGGPTSAVGFNDIVEFRANGGTILPTSGTPTNATKVTWTAATGRASANNFSLTDNTGDVTVTFAGPITSLTIRHMAGPNSTAANPNQQFTYIETVTYTRSPRVTLTKISNGGVGTFNFSGTNGFGADAITTAVSGTGVVGTTKILSLANTATTITEAIPAGYLITAASCTGLGAGTATPNLAAGTILLDAAATVPGANIACTYTNGKRPTVQAKKISNGAIGAFTFNGGNGYGTDTVTTITSGVVANGTVKTLTAAATATTITETIPAGYTLISVSCTGMGGGTATPNLATGAVVLDTTATAAANAVVCTFTNRKTPTVKVQKITTGGFGGPFSFTQTNLASVPPNITTTAAGTATPAVPTAINISALATSVTITETLASGFIFTTAVCSDANSAITGNSGSFSTVSSLVLTIPAANVVAGADFICVFTNAKLVPAMTVVKSASTAGPVGVGTVITYTFKAKNTGNTTITAVSLTDTFNGFGTAPVPMNELLSLDAAPAGDSANGVVNDGIWATLGPGDEVTFTAPYTVVQSDVDFRQ